MTPDTIIRFRQLFRGRGDVWGHDEGRCVKEKLTDEHWQDHLMGRSGIGVYPAVPVPDGRVMCVWGCTDIDIEDYDRARLLQSTLEQVGITAFIERSRSKGYHVWLFATRPVSATAMRNLQLVAHQVADIPPIEVNPKQTDVTLRKYGNYVRLPYMGGMVDTPSRRVILDDDGEPMPLDGFIDKAYANQVEPELIEQVAAMYQPPTTHHVEWSVTDPSNDLAEGLRTLAPLGYVIWRDGPLEGRDRSTTLARLAYICAESGMPPSAAQMVLKDADRRWGKFHQRNDGDEQLEKMVLKAYQ